MLRWIERYWTVHVAPESTDEVEAERYLVVVPTGVATIAPVKCVEFSRWHLLVTSCFAMFAAGTLGAYAILGDALDVHFYAAKTGDSATVLYQTYIWMGLCAAVAGPFVERRGPRIGMVVATAMLTIGFTLAQLAVMTKCPALLFIGYGGFCGGGFGVEIVSTMAASQKWFPDIRGLTAGVCMSAFGMGSFAAACTYNAILHRKGSDERAASARHLPFVFSSAGLAAFFRPPRPAHRFHSQDCPSLVQDAYLRNGSFQPVATPWGHVEIVVGMTLVNYTAVREAVDGTDMAYFKQVKALSLMQCIWSTDFFFL
ncbi:hypothetical protein DYB32_010827, partial [Aphanomyces invadans]